jgi:hypothetical protein
MRIFDRQPRIGTWCWCTTNRAVASCKSTVTSIYGRNFDRDRMRNGYTRRSGPPPPCTRRGAAERRAPTGTTRSRHGDRGGACRMAPAKRTTEGRHAGRYTKGTCGLTDGEIRYCLSSGNVWSRSFGAGLRCARPSACAQCSEAVRAASNANRPQPYMAGSLLTQALGGGGEADYRRDHTAAVW